MIFILHDHYSPDTAFVVDWYNVRRKNEAAVRGKCRFWIDTVKRSAAYLKAGQLRVCSQTTALGFNQNYSRTRLTYSLEFAVKSCIPNSDDWNSAVRGTAVDFALLFVDLPIDTKTGDVVSSRNMEFNNRNPAGIHAETSVLAATIDRYQPPQEWLQYAERYREGMDTQELEMFAHGWSLAVEFNHEKWEEYIPAMQEILDRSIAT